MATFGRLQAALASVTNEVTVAAANLNFDFTLVKCEAPKEYQQLGSALSQTRKDNAESGTAHITARRLGVLFEGILPATPELVRSYGTRVSEIAQGVQQVRPPEMEESLFAAHVGIDGTSIWAAATSSPTALHVQLLACMLARLWSAPEAISIWFELVKERRKQVERRWNDEEPLPYATVAAAAQSNISRTSLAEWDASVRSWLRTADRFNKKNQDQLILFLKNVNIPINHDTVYSSVISACKSAVETMEKLLKGMPQATSEGSCLLALSAWHLYPSIAIAGSDTPPLQFSDPLFRSGGSLTLGLVRPRDGDTHGVFWSLSLAHLNFYGRPVPRQARFDSDSRKITFEKFAQVVYGALLGHWRLSGPLAEHPARVFIALKKTLERQAHQFQHDPKFARRCQEVLRDSSSTVNILSRLAADYLDAKPFKDDIMHNLLALGAKRASKFIPSIGFRSFLGIDDVGALLNLLKGPNERVDLLRRIASSCPYNPDAYIIRYFDDVESSEAYGSLPQHCGFASAQPRRNADGLTSTHGRWIPKQFFDKYKYPGEVVTTMSDQDSFHLASSSCITMSAIDETGQTVLQKFDFICGLQNRAAIFVQRTSLPGSARMALDLEVRPLSLHDLEWCLESDLCSAKKLLDLFDQSSSASLTIQALSTAHRIYRSLPDAGISTHSLESPLYKAKWATHSRAKVADLSLKLFLDFLPPKQSELSLSQSLSCVAYLEGGFDLEPESLNRVFALAFEESIYFSMKASSSYNNT
ncbi:hypothetical protein FBEOM_4080 [Fusarium beomiforme]|uniref:Uncharacterized protein n=1 Tax=Fusarium beomiforme TaxID=44412 RepID=A0A9P5ANR4_9HYPO|nr:hypothetical protein FBEOM_4080 [Fusarium beomiforme]